MAEHDFTTLDSETLYVGKIFALRADEVGMPGGGTARREVIENYGATGIVALNENDDVALILQYRHPIGRRLWELPAGLLDVSGEAPHLSAARELEEEAGLRARDWGVLVDVISAAGFSDESVRIYLATGITDVGRPDAHDEEADLTLQWFPLADAVDMVLTGTIVNSLAVAGILAAHTVRRDGRAVRPVDTPWPDRSTRFATRMAEG
ncbi:ADP-ribose pyrophosphatase [Mycolicibacterium madagascariense]|uniref:ADP-ribose pyrophosphatase n=1 Tax=Mycolicibacterium madagascariense TaxID=212765 RepID=A0A7I7XIF1_9MYCO|nr:NUDIX hydrolase [Mycolicibacterium madagascariense]MCV7010959.1 NUDIX hydrolase [Mycolicibacterium madagascariense]BBZ28954.1 ADP-ribose pyrophosphatase [Mycolicibacterium madagascariense]